MHTSKSRGMTLIELLIVLTIVFLVLQLILPAIQSARESARQAQCKNNIRQLALGCTIHSDSQGHFPSGGWNSGWIGDPNRGFGRRQPGSWSYNILPYIEEEQLHDLGRNLPDAERLKAAAQLYGSTVPLFTCVSRRTPEPQPFVRTRIVKNADMKELARLNKAARSDYAGNMGIVLPGYKFAIGPSSYEEGDRWENGKNYRNSWIASENYGVIFQRSEVKPAMITDGLTRTFLIGEKFVPSYPNEQKTQSDDQSMYVGFSYDNNRAGRYSTPPICDSTVLVVSERPKTLWRFGSAHPTGLHMACCDASVHYVDYSIDMVVFSAMSTRNLGEKRHITD